MEVGAVITAAGMSSRMKDFKPLMYIGNIRILERVILNFRHAGIENIAVVTGYRSDDIEKYSRHMGVTYIKNTAYQSSKMFDSAMMGLEFLKGRCDRIFLCPVDVPLFMTETVQKLLRKRGDLLVPSYRGRAGHPILLSGEIVERLGQYDGKGGMKGAVDCGFLIPETVEVNDPGILYDADTQDDYQMLLEYHNRQMWHPQIRLTLEKETKFFGPGTAQLMTLIHSEGSVKEACIKMGISYSKGWKMISTVENTLGNSLVLRQQGGNNGGAATLTPAGIQFLETYKKYESRVKKLAEEEFQIFFGQGIVLENNTEEK